jgi:hypothetical protein
MIIFFALLNPRIRTITVAYINAPLIKKKKSCDPYAKKLSNFIYMYVKRKSINILTSSRIRLLKKLMEFGGTVCSWVHRLPGEAFPWNQFLGS